MEGKGSVSTSLPEGNLEGGIVELLHSVAPNFECKIKLERECATIMERNETYGRTGGWNGGKSRRFEMGRRRFSYKINMGYGRSGTTGTRGIFKPGNKVLVVR